MYNDDEFAGVATIVVFGAAAAVSMVPAARRDAHVQARGDARATCPSKHSRACMGSDAPAAAQPPRARPSASALGRDRGTMLAGDRDRETVAVVAPCMLVYCCMSGPIRVWLEAHDSIGQKGRSRLKNRTLHTKCKLRKSFRRVTYTGLHRRG